MKKATHKTVTLGHNMRLPKVYLTRVLKKHLPLNKRERGVINFALNDTVIGELKHIFKKYESYGGDQGRLNMAIFLRDIDSERGVTLTATVRRKILDK
jgi:hypothetical protein